MEEKRQLTKSDLTRIKRQLKNIRRNNKLYIRDKRGSMRLLSKISKMIDEVVLVEFIQGQSRKSFKIANKETKRRSATIPVKYNIPLEFASEFVKVQKEARLEVDGSILVYHGDSLFNLAKISLQKPELETQED